MVLRRSLLAVVLGAVLAPVAWADTYTYVGKYSVGDGPYWGTNPPVYSGREAAALLFGGTFSDYAVSTFVSDPDAPASTLPALINHLAWTDGWALSLTEYGEDFKLDVGNPGYDDPTGIAGTAISAYVGDHSGPNNPNYVNYVWRVQAEAADAPLPGVAVSGLGLFSLVLGRRLVGGKRRAALA